MSARLPKNLRRRTAVDAAELGAVNDGTSRPTCFTCHGAGGWQQPSGLIVECPRGCMTDDGRDAA